MTSVILNALFPERRLYLYDTFDRFPQEALDVEVQQFGGDPTLADRWQALHPESEDRIRFFYPRMTSGGYLMLHDYNTTLFKGAKAAVEEAEREFRRFLCMPLPDQGGSLVILKT